MDGMQVSFANDGAKNTTVQVSGILTKDVVLLDLFQLADLAGSPKKLRIESITFAIQEKAGFYLWWRGTESNKTLILPLESRGFFNFEGLGCLNSPPDTKGLSISSFNIDKPKAFLLILDMGKQ